MPFTREDFALNYREVLQRNDIKGTDVYAEAGNEQIGTVSDIIVNEHGQLCYLVVDLGFWIFGKRVMIPIGRTQINYKADRVYAVGLTREQVDALPAYDERTADDYNHEEQVRGLYRTQATGGRLPKDRV